MYVYYFEQIVRQAVEAADGPTNWALPYWNYSAPGSYSPGVGGVSRPLTRAVAG